MRPEDEIADLKAENGEARERVTARMARIHELAAPPAELAAAQALNSVSGGSNA